MASLEARVAKLEQARWASDYHCVLFFDDEDREVAIEKYCWEKRITRQVFNAARQIIVVHVVFV